MKRLMTTFAILLALMLGACNGGNKPEEKKSIVIDANTMLYINVKQSLRADSPTHLTPLEIVQQADNFAFLDPDPLTSHKPIHRTVSPDQRDFEKPAIKMWGDDIIRDGKIAQYWFDARDIVIRGAWINDTGYNPIPGDTIAYIPNKVVAAAKVKIDKAYEAGDLEEVMRLFQEAFTAVPITGEEWQALKAKGEQ